MKTKLSVLAAGLALAFSGSTWAAIANTATGNGELFAVAWYLGADAEPGTADDRTYTRDLGNGQGTAPDVWATGTYDVNDFVGTANPPALNPAFTTGQATPILTFAPDTNWGTFVDGLSAQQRSSIRYAVLAGDSTGSNAGQSRFLMSVNGAANPTLNGPILSIWELTVDTFLANTNAIPSQGTALIPDNSSVFLGSGAANGAQAFGNGLGSGSPVVAGAIGSQLDFWLYNNTSSASTGVARNVQFLDPASGLEGYWQMSEDGALIYAVAVPEPGTWAMLVAGLLAVGGIARRRMSS